MLRKAAALVLFAVAAPAAPLRADPNQCDVAGEEPDVIVGRIEDMRRWGKVLDVTAFSFSTTSCNIGTCWLDWFDHPNNLHPVIGQNLFRLRNGRFEQIGQSWLKHGFFATSGTLNEGLCEPGCVPVPNGEHLGVNCADTYSSFLNGNQPELGPKFEVNATTGSHPHPVTGWNQVGNDVYKRLQVHDADINPSLNSGASYFVEAQYVTEDDAEAGNDDNNASYRPVAVSSLGGGFYDIDVTGTTVQALPAIWAWKAADPVVSVINADVPGDGRYLVGSRVTALGGGQWSYEYAVHNLNSHRSAGSFAVPIPTRSTLSDIGFHDVDYHSGEPFQGKPDWTPTVGSGTMSWATTPYAVDPDANALRWGTLYNFRFTVDAPPIWGLVTVGLFRPGLPPDVKIPAVTPAICTADSICDLNEECVCPAECPGNGSDFDGDQVGQCVDCVEGDGSVWATPGEVVDVVVAKGPGNVANLGWSPPLAPGGTALTYDVLRSTNPANFVATGAICLADGNPADTAASDPQLPLGGKLLAYLVRARNGCPQGVGGLGAGSDSIPRAGRSCP